MQPSAGCPTELAAAVADINKHIQDSVRKMRSLNCISVLGNHACTRLANQTNNYRWKTQGQHTCPNHQLDKHTLFTTIVITLETRTLLGTNGGPTNRQQQILSHTERARTHHAHASNTLTSNENTHRYFKHQYKHRHQTHQQARTTRRRPSTSNQASIASTHRTRKRQHNTASNAMKKRSTTQHQQKGTSIKHRVTQSMPHQSEHNRQSTMTCALITKTQREYNNCRFP